MLANKSLIQSSDPIWLSQQLRLLVKIGPFINKWNKQRRNSRQRLNILREWIATQQSYIEDIKTIQNNIQKPLQQGKLVTLDEDRMLFPNLKAMIDLSLDLTQCLQKAIDNWNPHTVRIGQNIKSYSKFFMIYRQYCNNFMKAQQLVKQLKKNPQVIKIEQKLKLDIESYLIKPVQRPPKYQLLLRQYLKALPVGHNDYGKVGEAIQKYHEVNQLNNQSMDKQIRAKAMIKLQRLYGGVISSRFGREYLRQFTCNYLNIKSQVHTLSDMVIVLSKNSNDSQLLKRIALDHTSYVLRKRHLKYSKNMVFVCGSTQSAHLKFDNPADMGLFIENIKNIIRTLQSKEEDKRLRFSQNEERKNNIPKFKVSKWCEDLYFQLKHKAKIQITVVGTLKPPGGAVFFTQFRLIRPYKLQQTLVLTRQLMEKIEYYLLGRYPGMNFPQVSEGSESIGFYDTTKNRTQIIEHRSFLYQQCLNFVFRNEQFYSAWKTLSKMLSLDDNFFDFVSSQQLSCKCSLCEDLKTGASLSYYANKIKALKKKKKVVASKLTWAMEENPSERRSYFSEDGKKTLISKVICSNHYFQMMHQASLCRLTSNCSYFERIISLQSRLGLIQYSLLEHNSDLQPLEESVCIRIKILSLEEEYIDIRLRQNRYIRSVIEQIGAKNSLQSVFDWGLFLMVEGQAIMMPPDEKILSFAEKWGVQIATEDNVDQDTSFLVQKFRDLKRFGTEILGGGHGTLVFKKWMYFEPGVELEWCKGNKERYDFLINLIYGRFKVNQISLAFQEIVDMCALYLLRSSFEKISYYYSAQNIENQTLKSVLPQTCWGYTKDKSFKKEVFIKVKAWHDELAQLQSQRNAIEIIYSKTLQTLKSNGNWITTAFRFSKYKGHHENDTVITINMNNLKVIHSGAQGKETSFSVDILNIKYRVTTFSIYIEHEQKEHRFDGILMLDVKYLIEAYSTYRSMISTS